MVEITDTGVIDRIKEFLGLRGKAVVTSRNSLYPAVIVNSNKQQIPIAPMSIPVRADVRTLGQVILTTAGATETHYTTPENKVAYVIFTMIRQNAGAGEMKVFITDASDVDFTELLDISGAQTDQIALPIPIKLPVGYKLKTYSAAATTAKFSYVLWEENA